MNVSIQRMFRVAETLVDLREGRPGAAREWLASLRSRHGGDDWRRIALKPVSVGGYFALLNRFRGGPQNEFILGAGRAITRLVEVFGPRWGNALAVEFTNFHPSHGLPRLANAVIELEPKVRRVLEVSPEKLLSRETLDALAEAEATEAAAAPPPAPAEPVPATDPTPAALAPASAATSSPRIRTSTTPVSGLDRVIAALRRTPSR